MTRAKRTGSKRRWAMKRPLVGITFSRTKRGRVRFLTIAAGHGQKWSLSYASRQGARRAAKRQNRGARIAWGVA